MKIKELEKEYKDAKREEAEKLMELGNGFRIDRARQHFLQRCEENGLTVSEAIHLITKGIRRHQVTLHWLIENQPIRTDVEFLSYHYGIACSVKLGDRVNGSKEVNGKELIPLLVTPMTVYKNNRSARNTNKKTLPI